MESSLVTAAQSQHRTGKMLCAFISPVAHIIPPDHATHSSSTSRRKVLVLSAALLPLPAYCAPIRTILDEERELNEKFRLEAEQKRTAALLASFDAVSKASNQLDDLEQLVSAQDKKGVIKFTRLFNDAVVRNGMVVTAKQLPKDKRKDALQVCKRTTEALKNIDRGGTDVQAVRATIKEFDTFRPTTE